MSEVPGREECNWGMLCHLSAFTGFIIPFGNLIGPLIIFLIKKDQMPFVEDQGKESLNFQITLLFAYLISAILVLVLIGFVLLAVVTIFDIIILIIASIKASEGVRYRYPLTIRLIK